MLCSFLFYGVIGEDKVWLLAPAFILNYVLVSIVLLQNARRVSGYGKGGVVGSQGQELSFEAQQSRSQFPMIGTLFILFLLWGIGVSFFAAVPFL